LNEQNQRQTMEGGCLCGSLRYEINGHPRRTTNCHCLHCRRSSGAAFLTWLEFHPSNFRIVSGAPCLYESRPSVTRQFCGTCGTQLTYQHANEPDTIDVTACSLDNVDTVSPEDHVWCSRTVPWVKLADGLPQYKVGKYDE
jgi:hypothetical protein